MAEGLINKYLKNKVKAYSAGSNPAGSVNPNAKKVLLKEDAWEDYYSKNIDEIIDIDFDLVITVCDNAKKSCPIFPKKTKVIHIPLEDPDKKPYEEFLKTKELIKQKIIPVVKKELLN